MKPYIKQMKEWKKEKLLARACRICFRGKSPLLVRITLEKWMGKLKANISLLYGRTKLGETIGISYESLWDHTIGVFIIILE